MANYIIAGRECVFPSIGFAALDLYKPNCSTHYLAWEAKNTALNIMVCTAFDLALQIGAILQPATCMSDDINKRMVYLLQGVSQSWLESVEWYFRALGIRYLSICPYNVALRKRLQEVDELERDSNVAEFMIAQKMRELSAKGIDSGGAAQ